MNRILMVLLTGLMMFVMVGCLVSTRRQPDSRPVARQGSTCPAGTHLNHVGGDCVKNARTCPPGTHLNHVGGDCVKNR